MADLSTDTSSSDISLLDLGPLAWVFEELRKSLEAASKATKRFARDRERGRADGGAPDTALLRTARQHLHQAVGAMEVVGLHAPSVMLRAMEGALDKLVLKPQGCTEEVAAGLERAGFALIEYLDAVMNHRSAHPITLFPQYREVQELSGAERCHPADLWTLPVAPSGVRVPVPSGTVPVEATPALRSTLDRWVLNWIQTHNPAAAVELHRAALGLAAGADSADLAQFWCVVAAFFEAASARLLPADTYVKRMASRVLLQYAAITRGKLQVAEPLLHDLLFFCANAQAFKSASLPTLAAVRTVFGLKGHEPVDYGKVVLGRYDPALLAQARKRLQVAKESWGLLTGGDVARSRQVVEHYGGVCESWIKLYPQGHALATSLLNAVRAAHQHPDAIKPELAMEVATTTLFLEAVLEEFDPDTPDLGKRTQALATRIDQLLTGLPAQALDGWMEQLYRRVSDRQTLGSVVGELKMALAEAEKCLDGFFRNPADKTGLNMAVRHLVQMRGVLSVLGIDQAVQTVSSMRESIEKILDTEVDVAHFHESVTMQKLGNNLSALSFLVDMLNYQPSLARKLFVFESSEGELKPLMGRQKVVRVAPVVPLAEVESLRETVEQVVASVEAGQPSVEVGQRLEKVADQAMLQDRPVVAQVAREAAKQVLAGDTQSGAQGIVALAQSLAVTPEVLATPAAAPAASSAPEVGHVAVPPATQAEGQPQGQVHAAPFSQVDVSAEPLAVPSVQPATHAAPVAGASAALDEVDAELLEIFLEEAREVVANGRAAIEQLHHQPADREQFTTLRRAFHTLKGSSRMVGLNDFGAAGWAMEQVFNAELATQKPASHTLLALASDALNVFDAWVDAIVARQDLGWGPSGFEASAAAYRDRHVHEAIVARPAPMPAKVPEPTVAPPVVWAAPAAAPPLDDDLKLEFSPTLPAEPEEAEDRLQDVGQDQGGDLLADLDLSTLGVAAPGALSVEDAPVLEPMPNEAAAFEAIEVDALGLEGVTWDAAPAPGLDATEPQEPVASASESPAQEQVSEPARHEEGALESWQIEPATEAVAEAESGGALEQGLDLSATELPDDVFADLFGEPEPAIEASAPEAMAVETDAAPEEKPHESHAPIDAIQAGVWAQEDENTGLESVPADEEPLIVSVEVGGGDDPVPEADAFVDVSFNEEVKIIGPVQVGVRLFNVYLNEADEWSRRLCDALHEWALEAGLQGPPQAAVAYAHSLAGSSATVGFTSLSQLARALEHALLAGRPDGPPVWAAASGVSNILTDAADEVRRLLHQFAAGMYREPQPGLLARLREAERQLADAASLLAEEPSGLDSLLDFGDEEPAPVPVASDGMTEEAMTVSQPAPSVPLEQVQPVAEQVAEAQEGVVTPEVVEVENKAPPTPEVLQPEQVVSSPSVPTIMPVARAGLVTPPVEVSHGMAQDVDDDYDEQDVIDEDLFPIFAEEAHELLPRLSASVRQWIERSDDSASRSDVLRGLHTLKGSARLAGALRLGEMVHRMETAAERWQSEGGLGLAELQVDLDAIVARFEYLEARGQGLPVEEPVRPKARPTVVVATPAPVEPKAVEPSAAVPAGADAVVGSVEAQAPTPLRIVAPVNPAVQAVRTAAAAVRVRPELLDRLVNQSGEVMMSRARMEAEILALRSSLTDLTGNLERLRQQLRDIELQAETQLQSRLALAREADQTFDPLEFDRFTRVQELTRMMAESVNDVATVQRNLQRAVENAEDSLVAQSRQTRELQRDLLRTRMVEFEGISERLYRVVRQAAKETGKQVRLDIVGGNIEMDRGILDRMTGAFEHLLRNCVVHGIEAPSQRLALGKPAEGCIEIRLGQELNDVSVTFQDDGAGLDLRRLLQKAITKGLVDPTALPPENEWPQLVFMSGLSTADEVSSLAGRGVGMDVVRNEVVSLGGRVETTTEQGKGTRFRLVLPLTTAVTQVVMVRAGEQSFGIPSNLVEVVRRLKPEELATAYREAHLDYAGESLPFYWAGALLQSTPLPADAAGRILPVVILRSANQRVALHVDEVLGNQEVVVKNLGPQLSRLPGLAGMSILASGAVAMIYNPVALASVYGDQVRAWVASLTTPVLPAAATTDQAIPAAVVPVRPVEPANQIPLVMVVDDSITVRRVTQRLLQREGYRVSMAADGLQALERLQQERPTVVLSDIEMPRMDGFDLLRNIRHDPVLADLPVIMITSRIAEKHREHARELGANHYLGKPYSEEELLGLIAAYCRAETAV